MILSIPTLLARSRRRKPVEYDKICPSCPKHYSSQSTLSRFKHAVPAVASTGPVTVTPESSRQVTCPCLHLLCARCNLYPMQWVLGPHTRCRSRSTHGVNTLRYRAGHSPCVLDSADRPPRFPTLARSACHVSSSCARPHNADLRSRPSAGTLSPQHSAHPSLAIDALPHFVYDIYILFDACSRCRASSSRGLRCRTSLQLHLLLSAAATWNVPKHRAIAHDVPSTTSETDWTPTCNVMAGCPMSRVRASAIAIRLRAVGDGKEIC